MIGDLLRLPFLLTSMVLGEFFNWPWWLHFVLIPFYTFILLLGFKWLSGG